MLLSTSGLPFSYFSIMVDTMAIVKEDVSFRPDQLVKNYYGQNFFVETMCNEASNVSPISMLPGTEYLLPTRLFMKHFLEVG